MRLERLGRLHAADPAVAAGEGRGSHAVTCVPGAREVGDCIDAQPARAATGRPVPYAQVSVASGRAVGATSQWAPRCRCSGDRLDAVAVGFTWLTRSVQGTASPPRPNCCSSARPTAAPLPAPLSRAP